MAAVVTVASMVMPAAAFGEPDGGPDGDADTAGDNTLFMTQGVFVP